MKVKELIARLTLQDPENEVLMTDLSDDVKVHELLKSVYEVYDLGEVKIEKPDGENVGEATVIYTSLLVFDTPEVVVTSENNIQQALLPYEQRYDAIMLNVHDQHEVAVQLAEVMTQMERHFKIPLVGKERMEKFKNESPEVWNLYLTVSASRA